MKIDHFFRLTLKVESVCDQMKIKRTFLLSMKVKTKLGRKIGHSKLGIKKTHDFMDLNSIILAKDSN